MPGNWLKIRYAIVPIQPAVDEFEKTLAPLFKETQPGIAEENIQARARGICLMAISNKFGHILLNTTNKSECAVGYGTLHGDMNSGLAVFQGIWFWPEDASGSEVLKIFLHLLL